MIQRGAGNKLLWYVRVELSQRKKPTFAAGCDSHVLTAITRDRAHARKSLPFLDSTSQAAGAGKYTCKARSKGTHFT